VPALKPSSDSDEALCIFAAAAGEIREMGWNGVRD
jgi:hypothetical protein